jgi:hypothetical protein
MASIPTGTIRNFTEITPQLTQTLDEIRKGQWGEFNGVKVTESGLELEFTKGKVTVSGVKPELDPPTGTGDKSAQLDQVLKFLQKEVDDKTPPFVYSPDALVGMEMLLMKLQEIGIDMKKSNRELKWQSQEANIKLQLAAADKAMTAAIVQGVIGIVAGAIQVVAGVVALKIKSPDTSGMAPAEAQQALAQFQRSLSAVSSIGQGLSQATNATAGMVGGIVNAEAEKDRARAKAAEQMESNSADLVNSSSELMRKMVEILGDIYRSRQEFERKTFT